MTPESIATGAARRPPANLIYNHPMVDIFPTAPDPLAWGNGRIARRVAFDETALRLSVAAGFTLWAGLLLLSPLAFPAPPDPIWTRALAWGCALLCLGFGGWIAAASLVTPRPAALRRALGVPAILFGLAGLLFALDALPPAPVYGAETPTAAALALLTALFSALGGEDGPLLADIRRLPQPLPSAVRAALVVFEAAWRLLPFLAPFLIALTGFSAGTAPVWSALGGAALLPGLGLGLFSAARRMPPPPAVPPAVLLEQLARLQTAANPPAMVPLGELVEALRGAGIPALRETTIAALLALYRQGRVALHRGEPGVCRLPDRGQVEQALGRLRTFELVLSGYLEGNPAPVELDGIECSFLLSHLARELGCPLEAVREIALPGALHTLNSELETLAVPDAPALRVYINRQPFLRRYNGYETYRLEQRGARRVEPAFLAFRRLTGLRMIPTDQLVAHPPEARALVLALRAVGLVDLEP